MKTTFTLDEDDIRTAVFNYVRDKHKAQGVLDWKWDVIAAGRMDEGRKLEINVFVTPPPPFVEDR